MGPPPPPPKNNNKIKQSLQIPLVEQQDVKIHNYAAAYISKIEEKVRMAVKKCYKTRVVVMEN